MVQKTLQCNGNWDSKNHWASAYAIVGNTENLFDLRKSIKEKLKKCLWNLLYLSLSMKLKKLKVMAVKQNDESVVPKENDKEETEYIAM